MFEPIYFVDLHGTLVTRSLNSDAVAGLASVLRIKPERVRQLAETFQQDYDLGHLSLSEMWFRVVASARGAEALTTADERGRAEACATIVIDNIRPLPRTNDLLVELRRRGRVVLVTNTGRETLQRARDVLYWGGEILASCMMRVTKPDPRFYQSVLVWLGTEYHRTPVPMLAQVASQAYWIDDSTKNVDAARAFGFHAIWASSPLVALDQIGALQRES
jgi:HAD superfamily hydrolase (TIGR01509 family)